VKQTWWLITFLVTGVWVGECLVAPLCELPVPQLPQLVMGHSSESWIPQVGPGGLALSWVGCGDLSRLVGASVDTQR